MIPLMLASIVVPMAYGALAALAGKALIVAKLALVLASIIGIKKLLHKEPHEQEIVMSSGHERIGWKRSVDMAYHASDPKEPVVTSKIRLD